MIRGVVLALIAALAVATQVVAQGVPATRPADVARLTELDTHLGAAIREAAGGGAAEDVAHLVAALRGAPRDLDPSGDWSCRVLKLGGLSPLVAYAPFRCRVSVTAGGWHFEKITGSQRMSGTLAREDGRIVYRGVGYVSGGPALAYVDLPPDDQTPVEPGQTHAQVGILEVTAADAARLLLPAPILESRFDILVLTR